MNYITRQKLIEISEEELRKIKSSSANKSNKKVGIGEYTGIGLGFFISVLLRPVIKYIYFEVSFWLNIFLVLMIIIPLIVLKEISDKRNKQKLSIRLGESRIKAFIWPNTKRLFKAIFTSLFLYILLILFIIFHVSIGEFGIISFIFIPFILILIQFQNKYIYNRTKIEGKIGSIK